MSVEIFDGKDNLVMWFANVVRVNASIDACEVLYRDSEQYLVLETIDLKEMNYRAKNKGVYVRWGR